MSRMNLDFLLFKNLQEMFFVFQLINIGSLLAVTNVPPSGKHSQDLHHRLSAAFTLITHLLLYSHHPPS